MRRDPADNDLSRHGLPGTTAMKDTARFNMRATAKPVIAPRFRTTGARPYKLITGLKTPRAEQLDREATMSVLFACTMTPLLIESKLHVVSA